MNEPNFFSIDRLVEFGLGMAVARQMVGVMNESMRGMYVPGSIQSMPAPASMQIYAAVDGSPTGPLSESQFAALVTARRVNKDTLVWTPGMMGWLPLEQVPSVLKIVALAPPPLPDTTPQP